jgi:hypothetical protein
MHRRALARRNSALIEGHIESLSPDGLVRGWVRHAARVRPAHVQVMLGGHVLAEAIAGIFRADLLRAGHGHGHYGYAARLRRPLPRGATQVILHLPEHGVSAPMPLQVPDLLAPAVLPVEALLVDPPGWTLADLLARPGCLDLDVNYARLGPAVFVDAVFRFALARWPSRAEARMNTDSLRAGRIGPEAMLVDLLRSGERADMQPGLPSPFDPDFPFLVK